MTLKKKDLEAFAEYCVNNSLSYTVSPALEYYKSGFYNRDPKDVRWEIDKVIFNDPATIVLWKDGEKTVVKCGEGDKFDPEKGLAMAIAKKVYGNKGKYYDQIKKWLPKEETEGIILSADLSQGDDFSTPIVRRKKDAIITVDKETGEVLYRR